MNIGHIIELSHKMRPVKENFKLELKNYPVEEIMPQVKRRKGHWYILSEVVFSSHVGTHIEFPFHHLKEGQDASRFPLERLIGDAIVLDFSSKNSILSGKLIESEHARIRDRSLPKGLLATPFCPASSSRGRETRSPQASSAMPAAAGCTGCPGSAPTAPRPLLRQWRR